jgi:hypothetical protein
MKRARRQIDEAQPRGIVHLIGQGAIGSAGFDGQLMQEDRQQTRLIHRLQIAEVLDF